VLIGMQFLTLGSIITADFPILLWNCGYKPLLGEKESREKIV